LLCFRSRRSGCSVTWRRSRC